MLYQPRQCVKCKHLLGIGRCKAFPKRIPQEVYREMVKHDKILKNQIGNFLYEPKEEYIESDKRQLEKEKEILSLYENYKEKLPKLIFQEVIASKGDWSVLEKAVFIAKRAGYYEATLKIFPNQKDFHPNMDNLLPGSDIYGAFRKISSAEILMKKGVGLVHLTVYKDGSYEYDINYRQEDKKSVIWLDFKIIGEISPDPEITYIINEVYLLEWFDDLSPKLKISE